MVQNDDRINPAEKFQEVTIEYLTGVREYIAGVEKKIADVSGNLDMNDPIQAKSMHSFVYGLVSDAGEKIGKLGRVYEGSVNSLVNIVAHEYDE